DKRIKMWREIILCCLIAAIVGGNIIKMNGSREEGSSERLKRDARELVEMCLTNNSNPLVISKDLLPNDYNSAEAFNSWIIIDHKFNKQITGFFPAYPTYVLPFVSIDNLKPVIDNLQKSKFWNIKSPFVIVGTESRCLSAWRILKFMWDRDLLSVYYLCNKKNSTAIFTLNPYASYAPAPWKLVDKFSDNKKKISLFRLQFTKGPEICKIITFDKTDHLEDAEIKFLKSRDSLDISHPRKKKQTRIKKSNGITIFEVPTLINATSKIKFIPPPNYFDLLEQGYIEQLADNSCDIYAPIMPIEATDYNHVDVIAYYHEKSFSIATKKTNFLTVISDLTQNVRFVVGTIVLFVLFTILMFMINRDDLKLAVLDMVRLVVSMGLKTPLSRLVMKFVLFFGFLFAFLIVPDFQGNLSAILSDPLRRNIETLKDLYENKYDVYYYYGLENDIINEQLWITEEDQKYLKPITLGGMNDCVEFLIDNPKMACIFGTNSFLAAAYNEPELHVSKEPVFKKQLVHWVRKNWPLKDKFDKMMIKTRKPGFDSVIVNKRFFDGFFKKKLTLKKRSEESEDYEQFDFDNLIFNYYFIGFYTVFAFMVVVLEIILSRCFRSYRQL
ncbi:Protein of unknown function, partial [Cotesia congregata]